jgi:Fis family transcriptional regulator
MLDKIDVKEDQPTHLLKLVLEHIEKPVYKLILEKTQGNQSTASRILGITRNTLNRKLKRWMLEPKLFKKDQSSKNFTS